MSGLRTCIRTLCPGEPWYGTACCASTENSCCTLDAKSLTFVCINNCLACFCAPLKPTENVVLQCGSNLTFQDKLILLVAISWHFYSSRSWKRRRIRRLGAYHCNLTYQVRFQQRKSRCRHYCRLPLAPEIHDVDLHLFQVVNLLPCLAFLTSSSFSMELFVHSKQKQLIF